MARKAFVLPADREALEFSVEGVDGTLLGDFRARPRIASGALLRLGEVVTRSSDDAEPRDIKEIISALRQFFRAALYEADYLRFDAMLDDPDIAVPFQTLNEVASWLAQEYASDRPTGQPSPPTRPSVSHGGGSTATSSAAESTSSKSLLIAASA